MAQGEHDIDDKTLARFVPISELSATHRAELANHSEIVALAAGEHLSGGRDFADVLLFLLEGSIELAGGDYPSEALSASQPAARFAVAGMDAEARRITALEPSALLKVDRAKASTLLIWAQSNAVDAEDHSQAREQADIAALLLDSQLFAQVPPSNLQRVSECVESIEVKAGDTVLVQGEKGAHYYVIQRGRCEVLRADEGQSPIRIAELGPGSTFGEEALLTDTPRNASVHMLTDGVLLKLAGDLFLRLISAPLLNAVSHERAEDLVALGARWLDVRTPEEFEHDGLDGAINIPLGLLRERADGLPRDTSYVIYCDSGRRAQAAAFLLSQRGFNTCCLREGISSKRPQKRMTRGTEDELSGLHAELARTDAALEDAIQDAATAHAEHEVRAQRSSAPDAHPESERRLDHAVATAKHAADVLEQIKAHKLALDQKLREAEAEAASRRRHAETQCERMRQETQALLEQEKQRLASQYREASARLAAIEDARSLAEKRFEEERQRLREEFERASQRIEQEASRIRANMENARRAAEEKAESIRARHMSQEQQLRRETEDALASERRRLEAEVARSVAAQEKARQHLESTEAERREAEDEARRHREQVEAEERSRREREAKERAAEDARLREERAIAASRLEEARKAREAAEQRRASFARSHSDAPSPSEAAPAPEQEAGSGQLEQLDEELRLADDELSLAEQAHDDAEEAAAVAEEVAVTARQKEDELRLKLYEEMEQFISEEEEKSNQELAQTERYARELDRIQEEKERKRVESEKGTASMFEELQKILDEGDESDPFDMFARQRMVAEEKARLVRDARLHAAARTRAARDAVKSARDTDDPGSE